MYIQVLKAIGFVRNISNKTVTIDQIVMHRNNICASNKDTESVEANLKEMQTKSIINEYYKYLLTLPSNFTITQDDVCITTQDQACKKNTSTAIHQGLCLTHLDTSELLILLLGRL